MKSAPPAFEKQNLISSFIEIVKQFFKATDWKLEDASQLFYVRNEGEGFASSSYPPAAADCLPLPDQKSGGEVKNIASENAGHAGQIEEVQMSRDWTCLPGDILNEVSKNFICMNDFVCFGAVCVSWKSFYDENRSLRPLPRKLRPQLPVLLVLDKQEDMCYYYSLSTTERGEYFHHLKTPLPYSKLWDSRFFGRISSSHGWLIIVNPDFTVELLNPFLSIKNKVHLPPLSTSTTERSINYEVQLSPLLTSRSKRDDEGNYIDFFIRKAVLSASPTWTSDYVVLAIYGGDAELAFHKPGDIAWTQIGGRNMVEDVTYYKDELYAVSYTGVVFAYDIRTSPAKERHVSGKSQYEAEDGHHDWSFVESLGDLLLVRRILVTATADIRFEVFKIDPFGGKRDQMTNLCGQILFVSSFYSISLSSSYFPGYNPNCIYFSDGMTRFRCGTDYFPIRLFNLKQGSYDVHSVRKFGCGYFKKIFIWVEPTVEG
ncbi:hypothetical protein GIB67_006282 [Kingdonia uniflora]|uniref:KIB1-4 beta-propeller domain-containing protein n=1 Tax=Kingdonia uniflora TaxID=39325 RepID=A0A7J7P5L5_9MAGN|nr:hypothetical protein GIB67_006282 [Kingdonia uniflora]